MLFQNMPRKFVSKVWIFDITFYFKAWKFFNTCVEIFQHLLLFLINSVIVSAKANF